MKVKKILAEVVILVLFCIIFTACGKEKAEDNLVGKWVSTYDDEEVIIFNDDGTYMYTTANGNNANGSYKVSDDEIQMTSDASGLNADLNKVSGLHKFTLDGNKLSFSALGHASTEYEKEK